MIAKLIYGVIGMLLMLVFLGAFVLKMRGEIALWAVAIIGLTLMAIDFWQWLREED